MSQRMQDSRHRAQDTGRAGQGTYYNSTPGQLGAASLASAAEESRRGGRVRGGQLAGQEGGRRDEECRRFRIPSALVPIRTRHAPFLGRAKVHDTPRSTLVHGWQQLHPLRLAQISPPVAGTRAQISQCTFSATTAESCSPCPRPRRLGACVHDGPRATGQSQSARVPLSNRTACLGSHSTLPHRTARLTDCTACLTFPYHDITTSTRNQSPLCATFALDGPSCQPDQPLHPTPSRFRHHTHSLRRPAATSDGLKPSPNCFGPTTSTAVHIHTHSIRIAAPSRPALRPVDCYCSVFGSFPRLCSPLTLPRIDLNQRAHARPVAQPAEAHASTTSTHRFLPARIRPTLSFRSRLDNFDPDSTRAPPKTA